MLVTNPWGQPVKELKTFNDLLKPGETFNKLSGIDWVSVCDTLNMLLAINVLPDVSWNDYRLIKITNQRTYYQLVKDWIDRENEGVRNMDYKPNGTFAQWVVRECEKNR